MNRPSSFPAFLQCGQFKSREEDTEATDRGTERHKAFRALLDHNDPLPMLGLHDEDRAGVDWAVDFVRLKAPTSDHPMICEERGHFITPSFDRVEGTPDLRCGNVLFDLKWRQADYTAQMACYALMMMEGGEMESVECWVLFAEQQRAQQIRFTREDAEAIVSQAEENIGKGDPTPCDFCGWCAKAHYCRSITKRVDAVREGREDWELEQYHGSEINDPEEMAKGLRLARAIAAWSEAMEYHAKQMVIRNGMELPGFKIGYRQGHRFIQGTIEDVFGVMKLPQEELLKGCEPRFSKLAGVLGELHGMSKATAEKETERRLGDLLQRKPSTATLTEIKTKTKT